MLKSSDNWTINSSRMNKYFKRKIMFFSEGDQKPSKDAFGRLVANEFLRP